MAYDPIRYNLASVHPYQITVSKQVEPQFYHPIDTKSQPTQFRNNLHSGLVSPAARRKISRALDYLRYIAKHQHTRPALITLTLSSPQVHTDRQLKRYLFKPFLAELKRKWKVSAYTCRYEKQKNGRLHLHIVVPKYIYWNEIRNVWNRLQQNLGYVTRYRLARELWHREGFRYDPNDGKGRSRAKQLKAYRYGLRTDWDNPNSTDIRGTYNISNLKGYLMKYMAKNFKKVRVANPEQEKLLIVEGRLWSCSVSLSALKGGQDVVDSELEDEFRKIESSPKVRIFREDFYTVYSCHADDLKALGCTRLLSIFLEMLAIEFPGLSPPTLF